jgi:hypothetical protein
MKLFIRLTLCAASICMIIGNLHTSIIALMASILFLLANALSLFYNEIKNYYNRHQDPRLYFIRLWKELQNK